MKPHPLDTFNAQVWYESSIAALVTLLHEKGLISREEVRAKMHQLLEEEILRQAETSERAS